MSALFELLPSLTGRVPWVSLGELPTPVEAAPALLPELWLKRDDLSSPIYGGTKLRMLEHLLGAARADGVKRVFSSGATGSNFALATALHAPRVALAPGALCFPQPMTGEGARCHELVAARAELVEVAHWSLLPVASERLRRADEPTRVFSQVTFSGDSLLGYVAAGLELARQVALGACPAPRRIVLPIGSAATSAGLLAGFFVARKLRIWQETPELVAVRIAAFALARRGRVLSLSVRALKRLVELTGDVTFAGSARELGTVRVIGDQLGSGYPHATAAGARARDAFAEAGFPILDDTYSAKAAAHLFASSSPGPTLFWCTKSSAPLPTT
jgi:D-cysteine desulfhydrase